MRRLIVCDIDNTLLPAGGSISAHTLDVLSSLGEDTGFSIATGRSFHVVRKFVEDFGLKLPVITSNGAQLYDYTENKVIYECALKNRITTQLFSKLIKENFDFVAYGTEGIYFRPESEHLAFFHNYNQSVRPEIRANMIPLHKDVIQNGAPGITKLLVYQPSPELIRELSAWKSLEVTASMRHVIDVMANGATKGNAVVALASHLHIPLSQVFCFGDGENDVSMFTCGAVGIAMGNSSEQVKASASIVTKSCLEDGVAYAIENLLPDHS